MMITTTMMACVNDVDIATTRKTTTRITMTMRRRVLTKRSKAAEDLVAHEELQLYKHVMFHQVHVLRLLLLLTSTIETFRFEYENDCEI